MESSASSSSSTSSLLGSSKRAKAPGITPQAARCLVDGCDADLNLCRDYHRRHKVCQVHSKTAKVTIGGREQRFCQQCSRFHSLVEFDEGKRSCRKRLDGHNRRRRKPQPDIITVARSNNNNNSPLLLSTQQGPRLLSFNSPPQTLSPSWPSLEKETTVLSYNQQQQRHHHFSCETPPPPPPTHNSSFDGNYSQIQFLQGGNDPTKTNHVPVGSDDHALSLLSSGPTTREFGLTHHPTRPEQQQQMAVGDLRHYYSGCFGQHQQYSFGQERGKNNVESSPPSHGSSSGHLWSALNFPGGMYQQDGEGSSASGSHQTLTFMWE